jgi:hypothetical protein
MLPAQSRLSTGEHILTWNGIVSGGAIAPDGLYTLTLTAKDTAGNQGQSTATFVMDSTPPVIIKAGFDHPIMTLKYSMATFTVETNETANAVVSLKWVSSKRPSATDSTAPVMERVYPVAIVWDQSNASFRGSFTISYVADPNAGLRDGWYEIKCVAQDLAGNASTATTEGWKD